MKKLLALVLALVMTLGLATVAANASFPDAADIDLTEAVEVLSAVGVFKGDEKGNFAPKANLDRAAAAKLIAYLDLGEKAAEALPAVKVFNDVPASHWAAKYVAYCANAGYINGAGDGNFYPSNSLTGYAFGKMILCVLGYDSAIEGFTGSTWSINVAKLMDKNDINDGVDGAASATLTREQAAQYCLNALKADVVEYDTKGTTVSINGATIATGASKATGVEDKTNKNDYNNKADGIQQLAEKLYHNDLKLGTGKADNFGAPSVEWKYKTADASTYPDAPDATYNGKVTKGTIYTLLGKSVCDDIANGDAEMDVYTDGVLTGDDVTTETVKGSSAAAFGTGKGMVTEVYVDDDGSTLNAGYALVTVVVKNTYVMQATADYNAKTEKLGVTVVAGPTGLTVTSLEADDFAVADYKEDDYILFTASKYGTATKYSVETIEKAEVVSGKIDSWKDGDSVTLAGTKYSYSAACADKATTYTIGETATVVLDAQGNIIAVDEAKASNDDVVYVKETQKSGFDYQAKIVTVEGKKLTINIDTDSTFDGTTKIAAGNVGNFVGWMAYEIQNDGSYELQPYGNKANTTVATSVTLNKVTSLAGKTANSSTVYVIEDEDGDVTLYTGVKNAPKAVNFASADSAYIVFNKDNEVTYVYANATKDIDDASSTTDQQIFILKAPGKTITDSNKKKYVEIEALVDGVKQTLNVADSAKGDFAVGTLYKSIKTNSDGYISGATAVTTGGSNKYEAVSITTATADAFKYSDGTLTVVGGPSRFIKTDKVCLILTKGTNALMDDPNADYEIVDLSTCKDLANFVKGYSIKADGYFVLSDDASDGDSELVAAYIRITESVEA